MDKLVIEGGRPLQGSIPIGGAKNAALPILIASLVCPGIHHFHNVPQLADIESTLRTAPVPFFSEAEDVVRPTTSPTEYPVP